MGILTYDFMQRALLAAVMIGLAAPTVGVYLVQRRLALIGDGMGHVALTGVAVGILSGQNPVWTALLLAVAGAVSIELIRAFGRTSGDVALAVLVCLRVHDVRIVRSRPPGVKGAITPGRGPSPGCARG